MTGIGIGALLVRLPRHREGVQEVRYRPRQMDQDLQVSQPGHEPGMEEEEQEEEEMGRRKGGGG